MIKLASFALSAALGVVGVAQSFPAAACPTVGVAGPGVALATPAAYFPGRDRPYLAHGRYWHRDHWRYDRFHRRWY